MAGVNPVLNQQRLSSVRLWPPTPDVRSAVVLERPGGYRLVTMTAPLGLLGYVGGRFRHLYRVDLAPLELEHSFELPSRELARPFRAELKLTVQVADAVKVVKEQVTDAWAAIEPVVRLPLRQIGRRHGPERLAEVEEELHEYLTDRTVPEVGLRVVRAGVSVELDGPDLKREQERIEDRHRRELDDQHARHRRELGKAEAVHQRELDDQHARHRRELEKAEAVHQRELDERNARHRRELEAAREQHHHALETQRRKLYEEVVGEGLVPKLLLMKLGARPAGGDPKELDEVIDLVTQLRVDNFRVPLDLLGQYRDVMERWQLEEPVNALLKHLVATFGPQLAPPLPDEPEIQVTVGDPETDDESADDGDAEPPPDDQEK
jgi:hypothetical protein